MNLQLQHHEGQEVPEGPRSGRALNAESTLDSFRSHQRVFATAESRREMQSNEVKREVTIKKLQVYEQEPSTMKLNLGTATKNRAMMETKIKELIVRITEITNINNRKVSWRCRLTTPTRPTSAP